MSLSPENACSPEPNQHANDASVVFFATVTNETNNNAFLGVERVWKGEVPEETWTWTSNLQPEESGADGGVVGSSYLIYGTPNGSVDGFYAFPCATQPSSLEDAVALLGAGEAPRDFVATFDEPFPVIDGSPLGITTNGYVVAMLCFAFVLGTCVGMFAARLFSKR